jgi:hypothetical protein
MPDLDNLNSEIRDATYLVHAAQEQLDDRDRVVAACQGVERLAERYRSFYATLTPSEQLKVDRTFGRRVTDLRQMASQLPRIGAVTEGKTPDRQVEGVSEVGERRITGVSWRSESDGRAPSGGTQVGSEIDAWCGPCERLTTHRIVAMVGTRPRMVVCERCRARHGFRTEPARSAKTAPVPRSPEEREAERLAEIKAEQVRALNREVATAENVKTFDATVRYKAGDVIAHPEFGRGKVETVLRSSLLVRFSRGGLKSVMLNL